MLFNITTSQFQKLDNRWPTRREAGQNLTLRLEKRTRNTSEVSACAERAGCSRDLRPTCSATSHFLSPFQLSFSALVQQTGSCCFWKTLLLTQTPFQRKTRGCPPTQPSTASNPTPPCSGAARRCGASFFPLPGRSQPTPQLLLHHRLLRGSCVRGEWQEGELPAGDTLGQRREKEDCLPRMPGSCQN